MTNRGVGHALLFLAVAVGILLVAAPAARADSEVRIVRLSYVSGDVQMDRATGQGFERAVMNMPVTRGSRLWTGDDGYAEVEFEDGSTARLTPGTGINVQELSLRGDGGRVSMIELQQGIAYFDIRSGAADQFSVTIRGYDLQVPQRAHFRVIVDQDIARIAVFDGALVVPSGDGRIDVAGKQTLNLDLANPQYEVIASVSQEPYDQWDRDRASYRANYQAKYEAAGSGAGYNPGYSADYSYGLSDLNYWGSYSYISGWGWMWQPYFMWAGWNPWMDGAWVWYPGFGYVWVSAYPWGWMPYRYGGWYFISGHGWCWRPGQHWNRWQPSAPVHNPPPNFHPPHVPVSGGPHVVPVGRGPVTLYPDPNSRDWHGPRRPVDPGAPGVAVQISTKGLQNVAPAPRRPVEAKEGVTPPGSGPAHGVPPAATPAVGGSGLKGGAAVHPAPIPPSLKEERAVVPTPAPAPSPAPAPHPVVVPQPAPSTVTPASPPPPAATPTAPPRSSVGSGSGRSSGGSGSSGGAKTSSPPPPPPPQAHSSGSSGSGWSGGSHASGGGGGSSSGGARSSGGSMGGGSHSSGGSMSGGSHSSGGSRSSSSGSKGPK